MTKRWKVYKIVTPFGDYVGVTSRDPRLRLSELRSKRGIDGTVEIISEFETKDAAWALEAALVPVFDHGLNRGRGGRYPGRGSPGVRNGAAKRVRVCGVEYPTMQAAADAHGMKKTAVHYRLCSPFFKDWEYLSPSRSRYWQNHLKGRLSS